MRRKILADTPSEAEIAKLAQFRQVVTKRFDKFFVMGNPPDYEPGPEKSVAAIAQREGRSPEEVAYDYMLEDGQYLYFPVVNYVTGDHEPIREMLNDPACLLGLERRRRALHLDHRRRPAELHAGALGPRPAAAGRACRWSIWSSGRPARPPISSGCTTAAGSRPGCAPTST